MPANPMNVIEHWQNAVVILEIDIYACSINVLPNSSFFLYIYIYIYIYMYI